MRSSREGSEGGEVGGPDIERGVAAQAKPVDERGEADQPPPRLRRPEVRSDQFFHLFVLPLFVDIVNVPDEPGVEPYGFG